MAARPKRKAKTGEVVLKPVHPNAGIQADYRRKLDRLIDAMAKSVAYWTKVAYGKAEPEMATDAPPDASGAFEPDDQSPAMFMREVMAKLSRTWQKRFDAAAPDLARYFATAVTERSDAALKSALKKAGFTVEFKRTKAMNDVFQATVGENVSLIKSIPQQYLTQVQGAVMRSVQSGRDLSQLTKDLQEQFGVTKRRAAFISLDQTNKATSAISRCRRLELGLDEAEWMHTGAGKHPRQTHVAMNGKRFSVSKGMWDPAVRKWIQPGEEPNCRCVARAIVPGFP